MAGLAGLSELKRTDPVWIGLDVSKTSWHVAVRSGGATVGRAVIPARCEALGAVLDRLKSRRIHTCYESGPFGYGLHDWLESRGVDSIVVAGSRVPMDVGNRVKTDRRDSLKLATTLEAGLLTGIWVPTAQERADRELVRQRLVLMRQRQSSMVRIKSFLLLYGVDIPFPESRHWMGDFLRWLKGLTMPNPALTRVLEELRTNFFELSRRERVFRAELRRLSRSEAYAEKTRLLRTVPGIGDLTALTIAVEVGDWGRFRSGEAFTSYVGLTPGEFSSGETIQRGHITRAGNPILRSTLVESAWVLIRNDSGMKAAFERLKVRCGAKKAIVAIARKLGHSLVAMHRDNQPYRIQQDPK